MQNQSAACAIACTCIEWQPEHPCAEQLMQGSRKGRPQTSSRRIQSQPRCWEPRVPPEARPPLASSGALCRTVPYVVSSTPPRLATVCRAAVLQQCAVKALQQ